MDWNIIVQSILDNILVPIWVLIGSTIVLMLKPFAKKITSSIQMKNEIDSLAKMTQAKSQLMEQLDKLVETAVGANMQLAEKMKENGRKLTPEEIETLNTSAREMVIDSLPTEILDPEGDLYKLIGGEDKLNRMIKNLMEKHVYAYKLKKPSSPVVPIEPQIEEEPIVEEEVALSDEPQEVCDESYAEPVEDCEGDQETDTVVSTQVTDVHTPKSKIRPPSRFGIE